MRAHIVSSGIVVDTIMVNNLDYDAGPGKTVIDGSIGGIGWTYANGVLTPPAGAAVPTVPQSVTAAQGGIALIQAGLMTVVQEAVDAPDTPADVKWAWARAATWERGSAALAYLADKAGITAQQMDDLFVSAAESEA